jgi:hypothetical protein
VWCWWGLLCSSRSPEEGGDIDPRIHILCRKSFYSFSTLVDMDAARWHPTAANSAGLTEGQHLSLNSLLVHSLARLFSASPQDPPTTSPCGHAPLGCHGHAPPGFSTTAISCPEWAMLYRAPLVRSPIPRPSLQLLVPRAPLASLSHPRRIRPRGDDLLLLDFMDIHDGLLLDFIAF